MRINNPQLFNGQYLASREQIFEKLGLGVVSSNAQGFEISGLINQQYLDVNSIIGTKTFTDKFDEIDNSIKAVSGAAISVVQGTGITISGEGTEKTIAVNANAFALSGIGGDDTYASKYALTFNGQPVGDTTINIPKDQFLEDAEFIPAASAEDVTASGNELTEGKPFIKFTFAVKVKDGATGAETEEEKVVYVPVDGLVDTYTAGDGIAIDNNAVSVVIDSASETFLTVGADGLKLAGVQTAIDTASGAALSSANAYTNAASGALTNTFNTKLDNLISGDIATLSSNLGTLSTTVGENTQAIANNKTYIDYVSGQVSGLPTAITTAKAEAISGANAYTDTASGNLDAAARGYANAAETNAKTYADGLDFTQIVKVDTLPETAPAELAKDTLWVTADGDAKIGIVDDENGVALIDISKEVAAAITDDNKAKTDVVASTQAVANYVTSEIAKVNGSVNALNTIEDVEFTLGPSKLSATIEGGKVLAVYTKDGEQCYPTVSYINKNSTISVAEFAPEAAEETFVATVMRYANATQA